MTCATTCAVAITPESLVYEQPMRLTGYLFENNTNYVPDCWLAVVVHQDIIIIYTSTSYHTPEHHSTLGMFCYTVTVFIYVTPV